MHNKKQSAREFVSLFFREYGKPQFIPPLQNENKTLCPEYEMLKCAIFHSTLLTLCLFSVLRI